VSARVTGGYVDGRWGQVHYRASGTSGPWIGLFHESPLSARAFEAVLPLLGRSCRVVAFDTPGYGASDPPPADGFEIPDYAETLGEAITALGMRGAVLGGVHTGASIAVEAARYVPGGAAGLVLSGVPLFTPEERADFLAGWTPQVPLDTPEAPFTWAVERYRRIYGADASPGMVQTAAVELLRVADRYDWAYRAAFRHDPAPSLAAFAGPVLLLDAEHDLLADKDPVALGLATDARLVVVDGIPGQPHIRTPERYARELTAFALTTCDEEPAP
jgi:pimeloyl-ACP methyl ester carboxylesterase